VASPVAQPQRRRRWRRQRRLSLPSSRLLSGGGGGGGASGDLTVPVAPPVGAAELQRLTDFVVAHPRLTVITGAGCSTESGIPDYRSPNGS
jgi:hypothetical protein